MVNQTNQKELHMIQFWLWQAGKTMYTTRESNNNFAVLVFCLVCTIAENVQYNRVLLQSNEIGRYNEKPLKKQSFERL